MSIDPKSGQGIMRSDFEYTGGLYDFATREFRGFQKVIKTNANSTIEESRYYQDEYRVGRKDRYQFFEPGQQDPTIDIDYSWSEYPLGSSQAKFIYLDWKDTTIDDGVEVGGHESYLYVSSNGFMTRKEVTGDGLTYDNQIQNHWQYINKGAT